MDILLFMSFALFATYLLAKWKNRKEKCQNDFFEASMLAAEFRRKRMFLEEEDMDPTDGPYMNNLLGEIFHIMKMIHLSKDKEANLKREKKLRFLLNKIPEENKSFFD